MSNRLDNTNGPDQGLDPWDPKKPIVTGAAALLLLVGGLGGWSAFAELSGAVVASGELRKESNRQVVQHADGGVVADILVRDGDPVVAGDALFHLDETMPRAELAIVDVQLDEALASIARLVAERDGRSSMPLSSELKERLQRDDGFAAIIESQQKLFQARLESLNAEKSQLTNRIGQSLQKIEGAKDQITAFELQTALIDEEIIGQQVLFDKGLGTAAPLMALKREAARLSGEMAGLRSMIAQAGSEIAATKVQLLQLDGARREQAIDELRQLQVAAAELSQRRIALADQLSHMTVRAPRSGIVHALSVHARQAVIQAAEPLLYIVPDDDSLIVEVQVAPTDIDSIHLGQPAELRFPAFNMRTTPTLPGTVGRVSADRHLNDKSGESFFTVEIALGDQAFDQLGDQVGLLPGMPVEAHLLTESRTPLSYLTKPLTDQVARAMREE